MQVQKYKLFQKMYNNFQLYTLTNNQNFPYLCPRF